MQDNATAELTADAKQQIDKLREVFGDPNEELVPELKARYFTDSKLPYLNHPLVCVPCHFPGQHGMANRMLEQKRKAFEETIEEGNWDAAIDCYIEKPFRLEYLLKYQDKIPDDQYWPLLRRIWAGIENQWQYKREIGFAFKGRATGPIKEMFYPDDWETWQKENTFITAYRGCSARNRNGWSWTLDKQKAIWFAKRFWNKRPLLREVFIPKEIVVCYIDTRGEQEVIINPQVIKKLKFLVKETKLNETLS